MNCVHHWRISSPNGETCPAVCKSCGARRVFGSAAPLLSPIQWMRKHVHRKAAVTLRGSVKFEEARDADAA